MATEDGWVEITHTETGMTSVVHVSSVPAWETAGWTRAENGSEESGWQTPPEVPSEVQMPEGDLPDSDADEE